MNRLLRAAWPIVLLVGGWALWVRANGYTDLVAPMPQSVAADIFTHPGAYLGPVVITTWTALAGLVIGTLVGGVPSAIGSSDASARRCATPGSACR